MRRHGRQRQRVPSAPPQPPPAPMPPLPSSSLPLPPGHTHTCSCQYRHMKSYPRMLSAQCIRASSSSLPPPGHTHMFLSTCHACDSTFVAGGIHAEELGIFRLVKYLQTLRSFLKLFLSSTALSRVPSCCYDVMLIEGHDKRAQCVRMSSARGFGSQAAAHPMHDARCMHMNGAFTSCTVKLAFN